MLTIILAFSDKHPAVAVTFSATIAVLAVVAYCALARVLKTVETLAGRRKSKKTVEVPAVTRAAVLPSRQEADIRAALANLGYIKSEVEPVLADLDLAGTLPDVLRTAIKKLNARASEIS